VTRYGYFLAPEEHEPQGLVRQARLAEEGSDPDVHTKGIRAYTDAGFDEVYLAQVGPDQDGFFEFYAGQVLPRLREDGS
jgi:hypothetical protein